MHDWTRGARALRSAWRASGVTSDDSLARGQRGGHVVGKVIDHVGRARQLVHQRTQVVDALEQKQETADWPQGLFLEAPPTKNVSNKAVVGNHRAVTSCPNFNELVWRVLFYSMSVTSWLGNCGVDLLSRRSSPA